MNWAKSLFVNNARYYGMVLESQWKRGVEEAKLLSELFEERGLKKCRVLDVPCGIGRVAVPLARLGYDVAGVDISPYFVRIAGQKARHSGVAKRTSFMVGSMKEVGSLFTDGQFDAAMNVFTSIGFGSENDDLAFFKGLRRVVRKGGLFVIGRLASRDSIFSHFSANIYDETDRLVVLQQNELDIQGSRLKSRWRFYRKVGDSLRYATESSVDLRLYSPHELVTMLKDADWKVTKVYDSLTNRQQYSPDSRGMAIVAEAK
jgi:ubiquinone/menaquinone biosynthesis C-methylase UbiE